MDYKTPQSFPLTEEQCLAIGGHCYVQSKMVIQTMPPTYHRYCKHCGHSQRGYPQEFFAWKDIKDGPAL
jgi:hypothetical protein